MGCNHILEFDDVIFSVDSKLHLYGTETILDLSLKIENCQIFFT